MAFLLSATSLNPNQKPSPVTEQVQPRNLEKNAPSANKPPSIYPAVVAEPPPSPHETHNSASKHSKPPTPSPQVIVAINNNDHWIDIFTGVLCLIGVIQIGVYVVILKASRLAERAWISLEVRNIIGMEEIESIRQNTALLNDPETVGYQLIAEYSLINSGKTPARLIEGAIRFDLVDINSLPSEPVYERIIPIPYLIAPQGRPFNSVAGMFFNKNEITEFIQQRRAFMLFGFVRYRDIHNKLRQSRFALIGQNARFSHIPIGFTSEGCPQSYNRYE
jgi:hypothetical protein